MHGDRCFVLWNSVAQWGSLIHNWAADSGLANSVLTLFEIQSGDNTEDKQFHGMGQYTLGLGKPPKGLHYYIVFYYYK